MGWKCTACCGSQSCTQVLHPLGAQCSETVESGHGPLWLPELYTSLTSPRCTVQRNRGIRARPAVAPRAVHESYIPSVHSAARPWNQGTARCGSQSCTRVLHPLGAQCTETVESGHGPLWLPELYTSLTSPRCTVQRDRGIRARPAVAPRAVHESYIPSVHSAAKPWNQGTARCGSHPLGAQCSETVESGHGPLWLPELYTSLTSPRCTVQRDRGIRARPAVAPRAVHESYIPSVHSAARPWNQGTARCGSQSCTRVLHPLGAPCSETVESGHGPLWLPELYTSLTSPRCTVQRDRGIRARPAVAPRAVHESYIPSVHRAARPWNQGTARCGSQSCTQVLHPLGALCIKILESGHALLWLLELYTILTWPAVATRGLHNTCMPPSAHSSVSV
ncbi:hypothetical protein NDU88_000603 [Pleurodeles waltl]|uniref:Uncharacterized protein n=1 Tax=Pleurodeles waltl TaxID=8319 RepID=A0AAV7LXX3_PLEWA|nr:hypothetical protein NDU88_000603 [Pleurodeles waltl]